MERDIMGEIYKSVLPVMIYSGLEDTPKNRHAFLIGVRESYATKTVGQTPEPSIIEALTIEIVRLDNVMLKETKG